ncbi:hypothetical protein CGCSCA5_v012387 [Colletotrichum siamense]|nr:hypothetical protein CGCSCA5_v012387 [Colletotrichum siamense]
MNLVDTMYGIHEETKKAMAYTSDRSTYFQQDLWGHDPENRRALEMNFFRDIMFFLGRVRTSYEMVKTYDEERQAHRNGIPTIQIRRETSEARQISTQVFIQGDRAKVIQVDWETMAVSHPTDSRVAPVEVISSEPDTRHILKLVSYASEDEKPDASILPEWVPSSGNGDTERERLLPERIKIRSYPLIAILGRIMKVESWSNPRRP